MTTHITIRGAAEHNLRDIDVDMPRNRLTAVTGISGSGKSSLAHDVVYREGQRRFIESLSPYARQYLGRIDKPRVEHIEGLSPTISIDQKTISRNPRSTVGTITEILDHLRLLYARLGEPHCPECGEAIQSRSVDQIVDAAFLEWPGEEVLIAAPIVLDRKGEYRKELDELRAQGFVRARIDGELRRLDEEIELARYERHTVEVVYDRVRLSLEKRSRFSEAVEKALALGDGLVNLVVGGDDHLSSCRFACPRCDVSLPELEPRLFSFNSPHGACLRCEGLGQGRTVDLALLVPDPGLSLREGALAITGQRGDLLFCDVDLTQLEGFAAGLDFDLDTPWRRIPRGFRDWLILGAGRDGKRAPALRKPQRRGAPRARRGGRPRKRSRKTPTDFPGVIPILEAVYRETRNPWLEQNLIRGDCPECGGSRLRPEARAVLFRERSIAELCRFTVEEGRAFFDALEPSPREQQIGAPIFREIGARLSFLERVGLGYLALDRSAHTVSGGEAQRIRLASQLGSGLRGVLYVLDEPSIGLHPRDNRALLETLRGLRDRGNTVLVVEHDRETIEAADHVVDIGPGAGVHGGRLIESGSVAALRRNESSITGQYLARRRNIEVPRRRRHPVRGFLTIRGARQHNLKEIDVALPLGLFTAVTGVSGSGKSTLVQHILERAVNRHLGLGSLPPGDHDGIEGIEAVDKIICIDQRPIGRTPRSNPGTYTKVFDEIRAFFASTPESRARGYKRGRFSFNVRGGRCENCGGAGVITVPMQFLADVDVICEECNGRRYNAETLEITCRGRTVAEVLDMPIEEATEFFADHPRIHRTLATLCDVGLGYVRLGQPSTTLSGGEAQRVKLAQELRKSATGHTLYILDEPTTGLHLDDIRRLLDSLGRLVDKGNTVIVIEHNLDVVKVADHVIDLGPEGGEGGGELVAAGTPEEVAASAGATGRALAEALAGRTPPPLRKGRRRGAGHGEREDRFRVVGARENNLRNITVEIPRGRMTVITGPSGSGKSTLALDILFAEGQRRYVESLSTYARRFLGRLDRPDVDRVEGIAPAIAIDQKNRSTNPRSTVATSTEVYDYLRLLYARAGTPHCPVCDRRLEAATPSAAARAVAREMGETPCYILAPLDPEGAGGNGAVDMGSPRERLRRRAAELLREGFVRAYGGGRELRLEELEGDGGGDLEDPGAVELVVDRLHPAKVARSRLAESIEEAYRWGQGRLRVASRDRNRGLAFTRLPSCPEGHHTLSEELTPRLFSFNHHSGACPDCHGLGHRRELDPELLFTEPGRPLFGGAMDHRLGGWIAREKGRARRVIERVLARAGADVNAAVRELDERALAILLDGTGDEEHAVTWRSYRKGRRGRMRRATTWEGLRALVRRWHERSRAASWRRAIEERMRRRRCSTCGGGRLRQELLKVRVGKRAIHEICALTVGEALEHFRGLRLAARQRQIAAEILKEIGNRLGFLTDVGLGYLTLDRSTESLAGGEAQRIRLATQIGNRLVGVLYVLDEPTIGMHQRDVERLLGSLLELRDHGNSLVVIEHDAQTIEAADHVIDLGPGAGEGGGEIVASGSPRQIRRDPASLTGRYLGGREEIPVPARRRPGDGGAIVVRGASEHNLKEIDAAFPTGALTAVTGVSGSGKSTLVMEILARGLARRLHGGRRWPGRHRAIEGIEDIDAVGVIDQSPLGRTPAANAATYTGLFTPVRELFARLPVARARGYRPGRFSFNVAEGRCPHCEGKGSLRIEMHFLSDVWVTCDVCRGRRYDEETLKVRYRGRTIGDILDMEISEAASFFENHPRIRGMLRILDDVGLGYLALGQPATTLSGGEAQRVKLAAELGKPSRGRKVTILDEPTTGLHFADVKKLIEILHRLVDRGDTVIVIEHHLDVVMSADHVIDLGPEGGDEGGRIIVAGTPEKVARCKQSHTGRFLAERLRTRASGSRLRE